MFRQTNKLLTYLSSYLLLSVLKNKGTDQFCSSICLFQYLKFDWEPTVFDWRLICTCLFVDRCLFGCKSLVWSLIFACLVAYLWSVVFGMCSVYHFCLVIDVQLLGCHSLLTLLFVCQSLLVWLEIFACLVVDLCLFCC